MNKYEPVEYRKDIEEDIKQKEWLESFDHIVEELENMELEKAGKPVILDICGKTCKFYTKQAKLKEIKRIRNRI